MIDDRELRSIAMAQLLGSAETSGEINALRRVGLRAGFLWRCPSCHTEHYPNRETCCGKPRTDGI
ncbi:hypothetical protein ACFWN1_14695 [Streptomyces sp. NPDC058459]|uniref:hypothetical protein n=1 Tax=Streptomyces sp. NPDC058459 TaxID=3346508 RepID=UPI003655B1A0